MVQAFYLDFLLVKFSLESLRKHTNRRGELQPPQLDLCFVMVYPNDQTKKRSDSLYDAIISLNRHYCTSVQTKTHLEITQLPFY